ncbi:rab-GTPase-TBC domain-containing protein, partial [Gorgonomyces haynaldii]
RSLQWKLWLEILPPNEDGWSISLSKERQCYDELKTKFLLNPSEIKGDLESNNPLTLEEDSPWQQYYKDLDLKQTIEQDVKRTFPDLQLFQSQSVQTLLSNVLFIYSKMNMDISYRQGMHELCAIVYYVVQEDKSQSFIFDSNYLEHDTATLFFKIMRSVKIWYESVDYTRRDGIPIVVLLNKIQGEYLKTLDPELFQHLTKQHIEPQLFGLRWLRLLFAREFQIQNLLFLWDGLFQHDPNLRLAEWIATAMLIHIR